MALGICRLAKNVLPHLPQTAQLVSVPKCTFCNGCSAAMNAICANCGGELVSRPRRTDA